MRKSLVTIVSRLAQRLSRMTFGLGQRRSGFGPEKYRNLGRFGGCGDTGCQFLSSDSLSSP